MIELTQADGFGELTEYKSFTTDTAPYEHARHKNLRDAGIVLTKEEMVKLDLEVLPQRLEECKRHLEDVKRDAQVLLDQFLMGKSLEFATVKDIKRCLQKLQEYHQEDTSATSKLPNLVDILRCAKEFKNPRELMTWLDKLNTYFKENSGGKFQLLKVKNGFEEFDFNNPSTD